MSSISFEEGFFWQTLWNHEGNADLKKTRESPFVLRPGDVVNIPELRQREVSAATGLRHTFRRKGVPAVLRMQLLEMNQPLAGLPYVLAFGGTKIKGTTDAEGKLEAFVPPDMPQATLRVGEGESERVYEIAPRTLDPARDVKGIQGRLANLGYYGGGVSGTLDAATTAAIKKFQGDHDLEATGVADDTTALLLSDVHDSSQSPG
jgi:N-acetylmuramoyl-L-alanine amidase